MKLNMSFIVIYKQKQKEKKEAGLNKMRRNYPINLTF